MFTGGLGPTADDLTKETVASCYGDTLAFDAEEWDKIVAYFTRTGRTVSPQQPQAGHGAGARPQGGQPPRHRAGCLV